MEDKVYHVVHHHEETIPTKILEVDHVHPTERSVVVE